MHKHDLYNYSKFFNSLLINALILFQGLVSNATLDGTIINSWNITGYPLNDQDIAVIENMERSYGVKPPAFYTGQFQLGEGQDPLDTYLDMTGWGKVF